MKLGKNINPETREVNFGHLTFETGKKIMLDPEEVKEFEARLLLATAEGNPYSQIATDGLKFICPDCGDHRLECCEDGSYNSPVLNIDEDGHFDYGEIDASGEVIRFQCLNCGYTLSNKVEGWPDDIITDEEEVVEWIREQA